MTAVDMESRIVERLALCDAEIEGIVKSFELAPAEPIFDGDLPAPYSLIGQSTDDDDDSTTIGQLTTTRTFIRRLLVMPFGQGLDEANKGAEAQRRATPFHSRYRLYYKAHPRLHTATLPALPGVKRVTVSDSGQVSRKGPGGGDYAAIDFYISVTFSENVRPGPSPYSS